MQSLNKTQQFISSLSKKASIAQPTTAVNPAIEEITSDKAAAGDNIPDIDPQVKDMQH